MKAVINNKNLWGNLLLVGTMVTVFVAGTLPRDYHRIVYLFSFLIINYSAVMSFKHHRSLMLKVILGILAVDVISFIFKLEFLSYFLRVFSFGFFGVVVSMLIRQISNARIVDSRVIVEAINGYLLLGILFASIVALIASIDSAAYNFKFGPNYFSEALYYAFVTMCTLGYGDYLPVSNLAKSLSILITVTGQLYLAILIALLVGKMASSKIEREFDEFEENNS